MKKICVLVLALCLAVPAISHAGNATSRFDINIGGNIKINIGWSDQTQGDLQAGGSIQARDPRSASHTPVAENGNEKYGAWLYGAGETGLNFLVRGPDALGAKTSAFISGDFTGVWGGGNYQSFDMVIASINLDWANTSFTLNNGGQVWGKLPTWANQLAWGGQNLATKGSAPNLINAIVTQRFGKDWNVKFGISSAGSPRATNDFPVQAANTNWSFARSPMPFVQAAVNYSSGACGKVGPWQLTFGTAGVYGKQREVFKDSALASARWDDETVDMWLADFKFLVPIIPEKNGNKAGALYIDGAISTSQNAASIIGPMAGVGGVNLKYNRGTPNDPDFAAPVITGWVGHVAYFILDPLSIHAFYGTAYVNASNRVRNAAPNVPDMTRQMAFSLLYDVNAAIRVGLQYDYTRTDYKNALANAHDYGTNTNYRFAAYYFF